MKITHAGIAGALWLFGATVTACSNLTNSPQVNLAAECAAQAALIKGATVQVEKLARVERNAIDAQIALSTAYCGGTLPDDQTSAFRAVQAANAQIAAIVAIAAVRK